MGRIYLAAALLLALVGQAAAEEVTVSKSILGCAEQESYRKFTLQVQESGDPKQPLADAVFSHRCRLFDAGTTFVIEKSEGPVLVRVRVKGGHDLFWTSRLFLQ
jgi:hypothetical protein